MKLFTIGDSISQGFMSGAAARTDLCYSTLISKALGSKDYNYPKWDAGGLPVNIENIFRKLNDEFGHTLNTIEWVVAFNSIAKLLNECEDYYEKGIGGENNQYPGKIDSFHNIAVRGFNVSDSWLLNGRLCLEKIRSQNNIAGDGWLSAPDDSLYRTALKVLNPSLAPKHEDKSQLDWMAYHTQNEEIENVIIWLGSNNALGTILDMSIRYTNGSGEVSGLDHFEIVKEGWNLWHPEDFKQDYSTLLNKVDDILKESPNTKVFIGTIPLVTIAPLAKGVGETYDVDVVDLEGYSSTISYFKYYTYFPFDEDYAFRTGINLSFTQVYHIENCIRQYNRIIKQLLEEHDKKHQGRYFLVDIAGALEKLAIKRNKGIPKYQFPSYFDFKYPIPNTKYYHADKDGKLKQGGIFSLDGVHPSAIGQGLIAHEFLKVMEQSGAGVSPDQLDWKGIFDSDELYQNPIPTMHEIYENTNMAEVIMKILKRLRK